MPAATISHFETGFRFPTAATLGKLADALQVDIDFLLGREAVPTPQGSRVSAIFRDVQELSDEALDQLAMFAEMLRTHEKKKHEA